VVEREAIGPWRWGGSHKSDGKKGSASGKGSGKSGDEGSDKKNEETG
jgi:hypothetical protein